MGDDAVLLQVDEPGIAIVTLNQPERRNPMSRELLDAFQRRVDQVREDDRIRVMLVRGAGPVFCAGGDLDYMTRACKGSDAEVERFLQRLYRPFLSLLDVEVPTIAAIRGAAIGGGLGLALLCDLRICAADARLGANFARLGFHPGMGITHRLTRTVGHSAACDLLFTGRLVQGDEALRLGLVNRVCPAEELEELGRALAQEIAANAPAVIRMSKRAIYRDLREMTRSALDYEIMAQVISNRSDDYREGLEAMREKRSPIFRNH